jgi:hypothetical protein
MTDEGFLYIWLDGDPEDGPPDVMIPDRPGVNDLDQLADAIRRGNLGRFLPVSIRFSDHPTPAAKRLRSVDTARLLRARNIRHRRRYEVMVRDEGTADEGTGDRGQGTELEIGI